MEHSSGVDTLERIIERVAVVLGTLAGIAIAVGMLFTVVDVVLRQVRGSGVAGTIEYSEVILAMLVYLGMTQAEVDRAHVRTAILTERLSPGLARWARFVGQVSAFVFVTWMAKASWAAGLDSFEEREFRFGLVNVPVWPAKLVIPVCLTLMALYLLVRCVPVFRATGSVEVGHEVDPEHSAL